ncbi:MAG: AMP-binding protein [Burkholderiales bacterium]|nr:AMP-binding protein [Burkholderiales bacterium]MDE2609724.1 AMP-binding protein [Burkholderiales bacterium]
MRASAPTGILDDISALLAALPANIGQLAHRIAAVAPERPALREDDRQLTYAQLAAAVDATSQRLRAAGVRPGDRVMLVNENCAALVVLLLATANLGAWSLVANARLSAAEIDAIQSHARARLTLYTNGISPDALGHAQRHQATPADWADLLGIGQVAVGPLNVDCTPEPTSPDPAQQCAALIYTTGTTGQPKGVMLSHRNLLFIAAVSSLLRRVNGDDLVYAVLPISHVYGLASVCLGTLYAGGTLRLVPRFDPARVLHALANEGVTIFQGVPAMHAKLLEHLDAQQRPLDAPRLRFVYSGGSPLDQTLKVRAEARYGLPLHNGYGMTESSPTISQTRLDAPCTDCSVGPLIPGIEARLADGDAQIGELWVRGPNVMLGYYRDPAQTRAALSADGWLKTGDMARFDEHGNLHIVGRRKELIIRSGFNVYPAEVEQALNSHPAVLQSAVIGRPVEGNEEVVAFVELKPGAAALADEAALGAWASERLAPYKRPAEIRIVERLPAAATGKILKHRLRDLL